MAKKFKDLMEATGDIVKNIMGPTDIRELKTLSRQLTSSFHQSIPMVFAKIEAKLNWFGYTLGELELEDDMPPVGSENLFVLSKADEEIVKNVFIVVKWEKMATGVSGGASDLRPDGSALRWAVHVETKEIAPDKLAAMLGDTLAGEDDGTSFWNSDEDFGAEEGNLETPDSEAEYQDDEYKEGAYAYNESFKVGDKVQLTRHTGQKHKGVITKDEGEEHFNVRVPTKSKSVDNNWRAHTSQLKKIGESLDESSSNGSPTLHKSHKVVVTAHDSKGGVHKTYFKDPKQAEAHHAAIQKAGKMASGISPVNGHSYEDIKKESLDEAEDKLSPSEKEQLKKIRATSAHNNAVMKQRFGGLPNIGGKSKEPKKTLGEAKIDHAAAHEHMAAIEMHTKQLHKLKTGDAGVAKFHADSIAHHAKKLADHHQARQDAGVYE